MSEQAPERAPARGGGNVLAQKLGPLATWVWLLIATVLIAAIALYLRHKQGSSSSASSGQAAAGQTAGVQDVPDIILQDYAAPVTQTVTQAAPPPPGSVPPPAPGKPAPPPPSGKHVSTPPVNRGRSPKLPKPESPIFNGSYTVKKGETLEEVAKKFGITREELAHANGFGTGAGLRTGEKLKVPSPAPGGKPNKAP